MANYLDDAIANAVQFSRRTGERHYVVEVPPVCTGAKYETVTEDELKRRGLENSVYEYYERGRLAPAIFERGKRL